jgi:hypothetical protein
MIERHAPGSQRRLTLAADKAYDTRAFVGDLRRMCVTPHVTRQNVLGPACGRGATPRRLIFRPTCFLTQTDHDIAWGFLPKKRCEVGLLKPEMASAMSSSPSFRVDHGTAGSRA